MFLLMPGLEVVVEPGVMSRQEVGEQLALRFGRSKAEVSGEGLCRVLYIVQRPGGESLGSTLIVNNQI